MMKKSILIKAMGMAMACALVVGNTGMVAHAYVADDGTVHEDRESQDSAGGSLTLDIPATSGGDSSSSGSSSSGGGSSESYSGGSSSSADSSSESYSGGSGSGSSYSAPTGLAVKGNTASIPGCETFRQIYNPADGKASIYHKGIEQYTAQLKDADGNAVAYKYASPYKDETTGLWYLNIVTADGVDTTGYTIGTYKGSVTYLPKLGMSGVMLNQVLVVDATAE